MQLTKPVRDLVASDVFYINHLRFVVEEVQAPEVKVFWKGDTCEEIEVVSLLCAGPYLSGWDDLPADDLVCIVSPAQYAELQK